MVQSISWGTVRQKLVYEELTSLFHGVPVICQFSFLVAKQICLFFVLPYIFFSFK